MFCAFLSLLKSLKIKLNYIGAALAEIWIFSVAANAVVILPAARARLSGLLLYGNGAGASLVLALAAHANDSL